MAEKKFYLQRVVNDNLALVTRREKPGSIPKLSLNRRCCCCPCDQAEVFYVRQMSLASPFGSASFEDPFFEIGPYWCRERDGGVTDCGSLIGLFCNLPFPTPVQIPEEPDRLPFLYVTAFLATMYEETICEPCENIPGLKTFCSFDGCVAINDPRRFYYEYAMFSGFIYTDTLDLTGAQACSRCALVGANATLYGTTFLTEGMTATVNIRQILQGGANCKNIED